MSERPDVLVHLTADEAKALLGGVACPALPSAKDKLRAALDRLKATLRHPDDPRFCGCLGGCLRSKVEARRAGVICRYRGYEVKPLDKLIPPSTQPDQGEKT